MNIPRPFSGVAIASVASLAVAVSLFPGASAFSTPTVQFSLSAPDVVLSSVTGNGTLTEGFEYAGPSPTLPVSSALGAYTTTGAVTIEPDDRWGGSGSQYLSIGSNGSLTIVLAEPARYVGFWWGSGDPGNIVELYGGNPETILGTFNTVTLTNLLSQPQVVDVNGETQQSSSYTRAAAAGQPFGYVNLQLSDEGVDFSRVVFSKDSSVGAFELDNVTVSPTWGQATFETRTLVADDGVTGGGSNDDGVTGGASPRSTESSQDLIGPQAEQPSLAATGVTRAQAWLLFGSVLVAGGAFLKLMRRRFPVTSLDDV